MTIIGDERCETCKFRRGENCHRWPPTVFMGTHTTKTPLGPRVEARRFMEWPAVPADGWCGEWRPQAMAS